MPAFGQSHSLYLRSPRKEGQHAELFVHSGGIGGADFDVPPPFWKSWADGVKPPAIPIAASRVEEIVSSLESVATPLWPSGVIGLDGVSYELEISNGMNRVLLHWWLELPAQWLALQPLLQLLECLYAEFGSSQRDA